MSCCNFRRGKCGKRDHSWTTGLDYLLLVGMGKRFILLLMVVFLACNRQSDGENRAPTIVITRAETDIVDSDSARFEWQGADRDGWVTNYLYWRDDSAMKCTTQATSVTLGRLLYGAHLFGVQAVDDAGAVSLTALAPFSVSNEEVIPRVGTDTGLEIITWNVQNFPKAGESTLARLRLVISRVDADLYCIQEIEDTLAFLRLLQGAGSYAGFFSQDNYGSFYQKTGIIYKRDIIQFRSVRQIFWDNDSFPRPPLVAMGTASHNGRNFDFCLIVLHLKAGSDYVDRLRRAGACRQLKYYLDSVLIRGGGANFIVAGDWNDRLDAPSGSNVLRPFLEDSLDYFFLTRELTGNGYNSSLIRGDVIFDHILITRSVLPYYAGGSTAILRLDDYISGYENLISDHRPVMATFPVFGQLPKVGVEPTSPSLGGGF